MSGMKGRGHPVLGVISGLLFGIFLGATLVFAGVIPLNSIWVTLMPFLGIAYGLAMAFVAPFGRRSTADAAPAAPPEG